MVTGLPADALAAAIAAAKRPPATLVGLATVHNSAARTVTLDRDPTRTPIAVTWSTTEMVAGGRVLVMLDSGRLVALGTTQPTPAPTITGDRDLAGTSGGKGGWAMRIGPILICTVRLTISPVVDEITSVTWEFPERFGAGPTVTATVRSTVGRVSRLFVYDVTTTSVLVSLIRDNATDTTVYVQAIGPAR